MNDLENLKNDDQLLLMMEEMQNQKEELQTNFQEEREINSKAQKTISKISSENSILKNEVQKKSERIKKMCEDDLVLKKNEELEKENLKIQNLMKMTKEEEEAGAKVEAAKNRAIEDIDKIKREYDTKESVLSEKEESISHREMLVVLRNSISILKLAIRKLI